MTRLHSRRDTVGEAAGRLSQVDWLTDSAWMLTLGCLGCAILDSYTSLCVVGGNLGHIGSTTACPDFGGWDTRVFPLAVDMGWGGALMAVLRLARSIGLRSWRWWVVLVFEVVTAAFTVAGNAFHGAVADGATSHLVGAPIVAISCLASAVPGIVAVGSGFTLSVLVSTRTVDGRWQLATDLNTETTVPVAAGRLSPDRADGQRNGQGAAVAADVVPDSTRRVDDRRLPAALTPTEARQTAIRLVRRANASGRQVSVVDIQRATGRRERQARRLLAVAQEQTGPGARPRPSLMTAPTAIDRTVSEQAPVPRSVPERGEAPTAG
jgi:hypothetical protein